MMSRKKIGLFVGRFLASEKGLIFYGDSKSRLIQTILSFMFSFLYSYLKLSAGLAVAALMDW